MKQKGDRIKFFSLRPHEPAQITSPTTKSGRWLGNALRQTPTRI